MPLKSAFFSSVCHINWVEFAGWELESSGRIPPSKGFPGGQTPSCAPGQISEGGVGGVDSCSLLSATFEKILEKMSERSQKATKCCKFAKLTHPVGRISCARSWRSLAVG
jgi:hypothetical protein